MTSGTSSLKVLRQLASDAHSDAFVAQVKGFDLPMVVRCVKPELARDEDRMNRFIAEARLLTEVSAPGLLQVRSAGRMKDGQVYVLTDFADGVPLAQGTPLTVEALVDIGIPLCSALAALHDAGLVLGALNAHEILMTPAGAMLDASLAPLSRAPGATAATDVRALGSLLSTLAVPDAHHPFDSAVRQGITAATTALELQDALEAVRQKWAGATRVPRSFAPTEDAVEAAPVLEDDLSGQTLGMYVLDRLIGEGAMGRVYLAKHNRIGREAAIKVLKSEHARHKDLVQRFIQEATAVNAIKNEHIVEVHDFGEELGPDGHPRVYCVMEVLHGRALADEMTLAPMPVQRLARIVQQVTLALGAAHALGVVHRDIKPENIFLHERDGDKDYVKVLDFGVAKLLKPLASLPTSSTQAGIVIGTPEYMAPEQALGISTDLRVDLYAVGLVLYELLAGQQPFKGDTFGKLVVEITTKAPPPLPAVTKGGEPIPRALTDIVGRCLQKKPEDRYGDAAELAAALEPFVRPGRSVEPVMMDVLPAASRTPRIVAAFGVALLLGAAGFFVLKPPPAEAVVAAERPMPPVPPSVPTSVTLEVASNPAGAKVVRIADGAVLGVTPLKVEAARSEAPAALRLELDGYQSTERSVALTANASLSVDLQPSPKVAAPPPKSSDKKPNRKKVTRDGQVDPFSN